MHNGALCRDINDNVAFGTMSPWEFFLNMWGVRPGHSLFLALVLGNEPNDGEIRSAVLWYYVAPLWLGNGPYPKEKGLMLLLRLLGSMTWMGFVALLRLWLIGFVALWRLSLTVLVALWHVWLIWVCRITVWRLSLMGFSDRFLTVFLLYDMCRLWGWSPYDLCHLQGLSPYDVCR